MSCNNKFLYSTPCAKSIGGIKKMWYTFRDSIATVMDYDDTYIGNKNFNPRYIATLILEGNRFEEVVSKPDAVTITENITVDETVGSNTTTTEITIKQSDMLSEAIDRLKESAFAEYVFLFEDMQGRYFLYGIDKPVKLSSGTVESGNVIGDFNGGTFTFTTEGVLSRLWTKEEAEEGNYTSYYVKVKELFQAPKLRTLGNLTTIEIDTGYDFQVVKVKPTVNKISIGLNFNDNQYQLGHVDRFLLERGSAYLAEFDNDEMYNVVEYYYRKGLTLTDKRKFKVVVDKRYTNKPFNLLMLNFSSGVGTEEIASIEKIPTTYLAIIEGEVIFKREKNNEEDTVIINSIKYMPSDWK